MVTCSGYTGNSFRRYRCTATPYSVTGTRTARTRGARLTGGPGCRIARSRMRTHTLHKITTLICDVCVGLCTNPRIFLFLVHRLQLKYAAARKVRKLVCLPIHVFPCHITLYYSFLCTVCESCNFLYNYYRWNPLCPLHTYKAIVSVFIVL